MPIVSLSALPCAVPGPRLAVVLHACPCNAIRRFCMEMHVGACSQFLACIGYACQ